MIPPGAGAKFLAASSALIRHSIEWPRSSTSSCEIESFLPVAIRSCSFTMSIPVTISVTQCSTCTRVFISRKKYSPSARRPSTVPADRYPTARAASVPIDPIRSRSASSTAGAGLSSISFWCRRCTEQSRSPRWMTFPFESASTWTSTWRGSGR